MTRDEAVVFLKGLVEALEDEPKVSFDGRMSIGYRFTFKKGSKEGEKQLAALRALVNEQNRHIRAWRKNWPADQVRYFPHVEQRVCVKGRCGKGGYNLSTQRAHVPHAEASRFDVYVLNK